MGWHASSPIERIPPHQRPPEVEQQLISDGNRWMDGENYGELQIFLACLEPRHLSSHVALHLQKAQCHSLHRQRNIFSASCCTDLSLSFDVTVSQHVKKSGAGQGSQKKKFTTNIYIRYPTLWSTFCICAGQSLDQTFIASSLTVIHGALDVAPGIWGPWGW